MSNPKPAGKPAKTPRPDEIWDTLYQAFTSKTQPNKTELEEGWFKCSLCGRPTLDWGKNICPDCGAIFCWDCDQTGAYHYCEDLVEWRSVLVTEPAGQLEPGVTNEPCISPPSELNYKTYHQFRTWDDVSDEITKLCRENRMPAVFDIFAWKFMDGVYWHAELCPIPNGLWIEVEWGQDNVQ